MGYTEVGFFNELGQSSDGFGRLAYIDNGCAFAYSPLSSDQIGWLLYFYAVWMIAGLGKRLMKVYLVQEYHCTNYE
jgi:hypothetical protein